MRGGDKLLEPVAGQPLLRLLARRARSTGCDVLVTLPPGDTARRWALAGCDVAVREVPDAAEGMAASLRVASAAAVGRALMVLPGDMPDITATDLARMIAAYGALSPAPILRATTADAEPGHPVILPPDLVPQLGQLAGDAGARGVVQAHPERIVLHPLPGRRALVDLDTPEDWAAWRAAAAIRR